MQAQPKISDSTPNNGLCEHSVSAEFLKRGLLYKRRNGFGKHMPTAWVYRYFTLTHTGVLSYYETPYDSHSSEETKPRGRVHLGMVPFGKSIAFYSRVLCAIPHALHVLCIICICLCFSTNPPPLRIQLLIMFSFFSFSARAAQRANH